MYVESTSGDKIGGIERIDDVPVCHRTLLLPHRHRQAPYRDVYTCAMTDLQTMPAEVIPDVEEEVETEGPTVAHIVKTEPGESAAAKVLEARIYGTPLEALCGHVWVPSRDPKQLPLCEACKSVYDMYRMFNDGLNNSPDE